MSYPLGKSRKRGHSVEDCPCEERKTSCHNVQDTRWGPPPLGAQFSGPPSLSLSTLYCGFWAEVLFLAPDCKVLQENNACLIFLGIPETCLAAGMDRHSTIPRTAWLMTEVPGKSSYPTPSHNPKISYTSQWPTCQVS